MRIFTTLAVLTAATAATGAVEAADNGVYVGAALGQATREVSDLEDVFDGDDDAFKVIAGLRPLDWLGLEASYRDLGAAEQTQGLPDFSDFRLEQKGVDAFAVFFYDVAALDLFAKAGVMRWDLDGAGSTLVGATDVSDDGTDFAWGVGAQIRLRSLAIRLEYERFELDAFDGLIEKPEMVSLGLTWTFL